MPAPPLPAVPSSWKSRRMQASASTLMPSKLPSFTSTTAARDVTAGSSVKPAPATMTLFDRRIGAVMRYAPADSSKTPPAAGTATRAALRGGAGAFRAVSPGIEGLRPGGSAPAESAQQGGGPEAGKHEPFLVS